MKHEERKAIVNDAFNKIKELPEAPENPNGMEDGYLLLYAYPADDKGTTADLSVVLSGHGNDLSFFIMKAMEGSEQLEKFITKAVMMLKIKKLMK